MPQNEEKRLLAEGRFLRLVARGRWEWAERTNVTGAVVVVAVTPDRELVLVEQYRIPLGCRVIELPAGLAGDEAGSESEAFADAARRELLEETGFSAEKMQFLAEGPSSAGMTTEEYSLFLAKDAKRVGPGGGDANEDIQVHVVPIAQIEPWLDARRQAGVKVDPRVYTGLYFADRPNRS